MQSRHFGKEKISCLARTRSTIPRLSGMWLSHRIRYPGCY